MDVEELTALKMTPLEVTEITDYTASSCMLRFRVAGAGRFQSQHGLLFLIPREFLVGGESLPVERQRNCVIQDPSKCQEQQAQQ